MNEGLIRECDYFKGMGTLRMDSLSDKDPVIWLFPMIG
jgi:hypothetical protein